MPVMNGFRFCREVKKDPGLRTIPFIFYTATFVDKADEDLAMSLGASRFVVKPTEGEEFVRMLDKVFEEHRQGVLSVSEGPLGDEDVLLEKYESSLMRKLFEKTEKLQEKHAALLKSEQRLNEAQEIAQLGHWEHDASGDALHWSDQLYRILGLTPRGIDPSFETFIAAIHPEDRDFFIRTYEEALARNTQCDFECRALPRDGMVRYLYVRCQTIHDDDGVPTRSMGTVQDITDRKASEEKLIKAFQKAECAKTTKSEFLATMSHEVRTPLNGILGMLQILQKNSLDEGQKECVETAIHSGWRLTRLLSDILELSRIESDKMDLREEEFAIEQLTQSIQGAFKREAANKSLTVNYHLDPGLPNVAKGDEGRLRQILSNLVGNAIKFTEQGEVNVRAYPGGVETGTSRFELCFEISDTGIGIPKDKLELIYEPFTQVDGSYTRKFGGTGLGLSIVKRLVVLMDGELHVQSKVGVGTTCHVRIPVNAVAGESGVKAEPSAAIASHARSESFRNLRILLAEDDLSCQLVVKRMLEKQGHAVTCVDTGRKAVDILEKGCFDLIFMDIQMPEMDGTEATREIRGNERFKDMPIVAVTAHAMAGDRERFLEAGMNDYLPKPIEMEELQKVMARVMGK